MNLTESDLSDLLENCYEGNLDTVEKIIAKERPQDILNIKG